ncbi:hypothetical protein [Bradyrhizobium sp. WSM3983]|uniref:hypothetical protein n=1 Tax=Bradyrhizobium sp. WSM3983 TaxID=1038867 RepID=UPI0004010440|nr:hypothetical protein [Bradyrhizobium sp. WSM3983]
MVASDGFEAQFEQAKDVIDRSVAADETGLNGLSPLTPFFRFPYVDLTPELLDHLRSHVIVAFDTAFWASDGEIPEQELKKVAERLDTARKASFCCTMRRRGRRP